ncbi:hypothetical protein BDY24DRAFT_401403 [Mrakia frigida]|uniref:uncharacterized protein n=1 Tax=Mrakia frigida TaxID=29902 RepID=UPI003FCC1A05
MQPPPTLLALPEDVLLEILGHFLLDTPPAPLRASLLCTCSTLNELALPLLYRVVDLTGFKDELTVVKHWKLLFGEEGLFAKGGRREKLGEFVRELKLGGARNTVDGIFNGQFAEWIWGEETQKLVSLFSIVLRQRQRASPVRPTPPPPELLLPSCRRTNGHRLPLSSSPKPHLPTPNRRPLPPLQMDGLRRQFDARLLPLPAWSPRSLRAASSMEGSSEDHRRPSCLFSDAGD